MKAAVIVFPGSNCDRDIAVALEQATGKAPHMVWHKDTRLPADTDFVAVPGGFSFGDYLRCGAIAARAPIMTDVVHFAQKGGPIIGVCNGFQILIEAGLLPGVLMRNASLKYICRTVALEVTTSDTIFTSAYKKGQHIGLPVAHHDGNYLADAETLARLQGEDRIAFRYREDVNGSVERIAGIISQNRRVLGMMPHPERASDTALGSTDGKDVFRSITEALVNS